MKFEPVIKWSGSKRTLSEEIIKYFPNKIDTYFEPFCGGCSVLFQLLNSDIEVNNYICSDINPELITFFNILKENPRSILNEYKKRWEKLNSFNEINDKREYYNQIRSNYNKTKNIYDFIFLTRTSINGLIRYNSKGEFNVPFHFLRNGINPERLNKIVYQWSDKLNEKNVKFINCSFKEIKPTSGDYLFLDPPYANTKGMYYGTIDFEEFWKWIETINCSYALTFDGKRTDKDNTYNVPKRIYTKHIYLDEKISGFKKLHKEKKYVRESLYLK